MTGGYVLCVLSFSLTEGSYNNVIKIFIEDHNGLIGFSTMKGKGTTFFLFLPLETDEEDKPSQNVKRAKRATRAFIKTTNQ